MRSPDPLRYQPTFPAPERAVLAVLHTTLCAVEALLRDEHPDLDAPDIADQQHAYIVRLAAHLLVRRCADLRTLLDFYDRAVDDVSSPAADPF